MTTVDIFVVTASSKSLFLRNVPSDLIREAKAEAARRGQTLTAVVTSALRRSLSMEHDTEDPADEIERDIAWYRKNRAALLRRYGGKYIAIIDGVVVDHANDFHQLATRVFSRFGNRAIYMPRVEADEVVVRVRSPRVVAP